MWLKTEKPENKPETAKEPILAFSSVLFAHWYGENRRLI
jgi:hypothetical protein